MEKGNENIYYYVLENKKDVIKIIKDNKVNKNLYDVPYFNPK